MAKANAFQHAFPVNMFVPFTGFGWGCPYRCALGCLFAHWSMTTPGNILGSCQPYKWPYNWITAVITPINGYLVGGPPCTWWKDLRPRCVPVRTMVKKTLSISGWWMRICKSFIKNLLNLLTSHRHSEQKVASILLEAQLHIDLYEFIMTWNNGSRPCSPFPSPYPSLGLCQWLGSSCCPHPSKCQILKEK